MVKSLKQAVVKEILDTCGIPIRLGGLIKHGVRGDYVWNAKMQGEKVKDVVVKYGQDIGSREKAGVYKLGKYLPLAPGVAFGANYSIYQKIEGPTLHEVVQSCSTESWRLLENYIRIHRNLWYKTTVNNTSLEGYSKKIGNTIEIAKNISVTDVSGIALPLGEVFDHEWVVNGSLIGNPLEKLHIMESCILRRGRGALTHGDEGAGNAIIEKANGKIYMVDNGNAGIRDIHESIVKILLWFDVTMTKTRDFTLERRHGKVFLKTSHLIPAGASSAINCIRKSFEDYLDSPEERRITSAYMVMYLLREMQWLKARDRENILPYLLAKALTVSVGLTK